MVHKIPATITPTMAPKNVEKKFFIFIKFINAKVKHLVTFEQELL
jgi:hypothetical protein